jgi:two-component SAPR family response regulator
MGTPVPAVERADVSTIMAAVQKTLLPEQFRLHWTEGEILSLDELLDERAAAPTMSVPMTIVESRTEPLHILALGTAEVRRNDTLLDTADWGYAKPRELFYFLLDSGPVRKSDIGTELWPDASPASLRNSFHSCLHQLRQTLGRSDWITYRKGRYEFNRALDHRYDVAELESAVSADNLRHAVDLYRGDYLLDLPESGWVEARRHSLRQLFEQVLLRLARQRTAAGDHAGAIDLYERAIAHDRLLEPAYSALIELYLDQGNRARAVRQYKLLTTVLADELQTAPSPRTTALLSPQR